MVIEELSSKENNKHVTVTLTYEEVRDISNGLYYLTHGGECKKDDYRLVSAQTKLLFDMVKHGMIQPETFNHFDELNCKNIN